MNKRKFEDYNEIVNSGPHKKAKETVYIKKNSLDSDEEDEAGDEADYMIDEDDIEGEEDGVAGNYGEIRTTAFNMREELEEGHFDKDGHYIWNKEKEIRDSWLENIDWQTIRPVPQNEKKTDKGLGDESDDSEEETDKTELNLERYKKILQYLKPKETIAKALQRLGGNKKKLSSVERLKLKKAGLLNPNEEIIKLTELANGLLNDTGNMDIYQETYEKISKMIEDVENPSEPAKQAEELDMYADDFDDKEKQRLDVPSTSSLKADSNMKSESVLMWEFKQSKSEDGIVQGPYTSEQMQKFLMEGKFEKGVWVRKLGQDQFYSSSRIDFELYIS